ncbi:MAG: hypothetical protein K6G73_01130 [Marinilabiliaceae bacterium]|nr:hypothetical protein [Marinilabiliaceae bacterium]
MNEQRNISLQGRSLAFSHTVGRAYGERELAIGVTAYGFASALGFGDVVDDFTNHIGRKIIYGYEEDY